MRVRGDGLNGGRYRRNALSKVRLTTLRNALGKCGHCVADSAREVGMSYSTAKYCNGKFGSFWDGEKPEQWKPV